MFRLLSKDTKKLESKRKKLSYLNLRLGHAQCIGELGSLRASQVLGLFEGLLQGEDLLPTEGGPRVLLLAILVDAACLRGARAQGPVTHCNKDVY